MEAVKFFVAGRPAPQGSKKSVGRGRFVEASKYLKPWRQAVYSAAEAAWDGRPLLDVPVSVEYEFILDRPKSPSWEWPAGAPDIEKLVRAVNDSLQGTVITNDARVVECVAAKRWTSPDEPISGCFIRVVTI